MGLWNYPINGKLFKYIISSMKISACSSKELKKGVSLFDQKTQGGAGVCHTKYTIGTHPGIQQGLFTTPSKQWAQGEPSHSFIR